MPYAFMDDGVCALQPSGCSPHDMQPGMPACPMGDRRAQTGVDKLLLPPLTQPHVISGRLLY
jgi:hypothetical protein